MRGACLIVLGLFAAGCVGGELRLSQVEGTVQVKGKPLAGVEVLFYPEAEGDAPLARGVTDEQGRYRLSVFDRAADQHRPGVLPGKYRVTLTDHGRGEHGVAPPPSSLPAHYTRFDKTPLRYEVRDGEQTIDIMAN